MRKQFVIFVVILLVSMAFAQTNPKQLPIPEECIEKIDLEKIVRSNADWKPVRCDFDDTIMVLVPKGSFVMGSENGYPVERPTSKQKFHSPFWVDETEVTRGAYESCVSAGECTPTPNNQYSTEANQPINRVTWYQAATYCRWRGARLPTEREWEYVARGPDNLVYPWGNEFDGNKLYYFENSGNETAIVGKYPKGISWVGALNMSGNVWEWTGSLYKDYPYISNDGRELTGNEENIGEEIAVRGGSFNNSSTFLHAADREWYDADFNSPTNGFRCASS